MPKGIVVSGIGGLYTVWDCGALYKCKARGLLKKDGKILLPGDKVDYDYDTEKDEGIVVSVDPRLNEFIRPAVSNIYGLVIVMTPKNPVPDLLLLDKLIINAYINKIIPYICVNKIDLDIDNGFSNYIINTYEKCTGIPTFLLSSAKRCGQEFLIPVLKDNITLLAGQSGVGKSTITNNFFENDKMKTGEISKKALRGKHTTRHAELLELSFGGFLVDTPGFSNLTVQIDLKYKLKNLYPEFKILSESCKYADCNHVDEPECAVKNAVISNHIDSGRYERYKELYARLKNNIWER